jgi:hypothetical protein
VSPGVGAAAIGEERPRQCFIGEAAEVERAAISHMDLGAMAQCASYEGTHACAASASYRKDDFADYSGGVPVELHFTFYLADHCRHHARAEAFMGRDPDGRAPRFGPS